MQKSVAHKQHHPSLPYLNLQADVCLFAGYSIYHVKCDASPQIRKERSSDPVSASHLENSICIQK